jgi:hypothetical protein
VTRTAFFAMCATLLVVALMMAGCGAPVYPSSRIPGLEMGSPLKGVPAKVFLVPDFSDDRVIDPAAEIRMDKPVASAIHDAICRELVRNGHTCVSSATEGKADFFVSGSVYQFHVTFERPTGITGLLNADVGMKLRFNRAGNASSEYTKKYTGNSRYSTAGALLVGAAFSTYDQAIQNAVREFSTDPDLNAFLKESK